MSSTDIRYMKMALGLGARGLGRVWPNPAVGCVIVKDGRVVGRGHTADGGRPHAEVVALLEAGEAARGATVYVTLEPCSHQGQSGPCADALIAAGVARVVVGCSDPNPEVNGQGIEKLRKSRIEVATPVLETEAIEAHRGFFLSVTNGRPFVTLKLASTLDGRIATASGESRWITGSEARRSVHSLRMRHDAVLVGAGTARADDPDLQVRNMGCDRQPVRVVASRNLNLPKPSRLTDSVEFGPVWFVHGEGADVYAWQDAGVDLIEAPVSGGQLDPLGMLQALAAKGLTRVLCEGGGELAASLLSSGLVDELVVFSAGKVLGAEGWPSVGAMGVSELAQAPKFALHDVQTVGSDVMQIWRPEGANS